MAENDIFKLQDKNKQLAKTINELFFEWFDDGYKLRRKDENFSAEASLDKLTKIVNALLATCHKQSADKAANEVYSNMNAFLSGDSDAAVSILHNREKTDPISQLIWLINVSTPVAILSKNLNQVNEPLNKGPLRRLKVSAKNLEKVVVNVSNSTQMKSAADFLGKVLPSTFAAVAKHKHLLKSIEKRAAFSGNQYHNVETFDTIYHDLGEALILVSTDFFAEANAALTENGKRLAADKVKNFDFKQLSATEQDKLMQTMAVTFRKYSNFTVELNMLSNINDKLIMDSALNVFYTKMNDKQRDMCGFTEHDLVSLPKAIEFSKKYKNEYEACYNKYSSELVDGMTEAIKREQETVNKDWFYNKLTGERVFRRGRLAGHGNKFMNTAPMKWLDEKMQSKEWLSFWAIPKLSMNVLKLMTNPVVHKLRKKFTGMLFAGLREFARGVRESFDKTGRSTEINYDDVIKAIKDAEAKLKNLHGEKTILTGESTEVNGTLLEAEAEDAAEERYTDITRTDIANIEKALRALENCKHRFEKAVSDEAVTRDVNAYETYRSRIENYIGAKNLHNVLDNISNLRTSDDTIDFDATGELVSKFKDAYDEFIADQQEFDQKQSDRDEIDSANAKDKSSSTENSITVGEQSVKICEDVYAVLNKYIARQWNLLALHSIDSRMQLCAMYTPIDTAELIAGAGPKTSDSRLSDWIAAKYPIKYENKYRYHGIELHASSEDSSKNGFGVFADRLCKITNAVKEFYDYVEALGNESAKKTFDNSDKDEYVNATESFVSADELLNDLNEDIANKIFTRADKAADKVGDYAKKPIRGLGNLVGTGIGKAIHGITHTSTADKDINLAKTVDGNMELVYSYSKKLRLSYFIDGANILAKHCLTNSAKKEFENIAELGKALSESNIANARSILAVSEALAAFNDKVSNMQFKPCKAIVDYSMAKLIIEGKLTDDDNKNFGMIKGLYVGNFEAATEFARKNTTEEKLERIGAKLERNGGDPDSLTKEELALYLSDGKTADIAQFDLAVDDDYDEDGNELPQENNVEEPEAQTSDTDETAEETNSNIAADSDKIGKDLSKAKVDDDAVKSMASKDLDAQQDSHTISTRTNTDFNEPMTVAAPADAELKHKNTFSNDQWNKLNRTDRAKLAKRGAYDENGRKRSSKLENVKLDTLSDMLSEINKIDWKEFLHG